MVKAKNDDDDDQGATIDGENAQGGSQFISLCL